MDNLNQNEDKSVTPKAEINSIDLNEKEIIENLLDSKIPEEIKPLIEELPPEKKNKVEAAILSLSISKYFSGPLPHPDTLAEYNKIIPNGADRIFERSEKQSDHRMALEKISVDAGIKQSAQGQIFGFIISLQKIIY